MKLPNSLVNKSMASTTTLSVAVENDQASRPAQGGRQEFSSRRRGSLHSATRGRLQRSRRHSRSVDPVLNRNRRCVAAGSSDQLAARLARDGNSEPIYIE